VLSSRPRALAAVSPGEPSSRRSCPTTGFRSVRRTRSQVTAGHLFAVSPGSRICSPAVRSPARTDRLCEPGPDARALECIELHARLVGDFGGNRAQSVDRPGRHGGVLGVPRDAMLGSSPASTPVSRSQARVVDPISLLDVRSVLGDASLLAALSRGARVRPLSRLVTARSRRPARALSRRSTRRLVLSQRGVPRFPPGRRRLDPAKPRGRGLPPRPSPGLPGRGVTLVRPGNIAATSPLSSSSLTPGGERTAARSAHHYRRRPRDHYRATSLLRLFSEPDDNTTKRTIPMTNGRKTRQRRQDRPPPRRDGPSPSLAPPSRRRPSRRAATPETTRSSSSGPTCRPDSTRPRWASGWPHPIRRRR
jgi:hypothetical protein